jgi:hypothetical protein
MFDRHSDEVDIAELMEPWLTRPGCPGVVVEVTEAPPTLVLSQVRQEHVMAEAQP